MITGTVYEFNMQSTNTAKGDLVSYDASERQLVYYIDKKIISFQLDLKADVQQINEQKAYDIRDPQVWTLKNLYLHLQAKQDSMHLKDCSIQFVIQDSTGKIKDSYPAHLANTKQLSVSFPVIHYMPDTTILTGNLFKQRSGRFL